MVKSKSKILFGLMMVVSLAVPFNVFAAWLGVDNIESYANGDLTGGVGGTGWGADDWTGAFEFDVNEAAAYQGTKSVRILIDTGEITRTSDTTDTTYTNILKVAVQRTDKTTGRFAIGARNGTTGRGFLILGTTDITITDASGTNSVTIVSGYSVGTWYEIHWAFDSTNAAHKARLVGDSVWSSPSVLSSTGVVNNLRMINLEIISGTAYFDDIGAGSEPGGGGGGATVRSIKPQRAALLSRRR